MESVISIQNFSKSFGPLKAVDDLSFEVHNDDIFAFLGSNGSGKTTTIRCLLDIYQADAGKLLIKGEKYTEKMNNILGYLPEERGLYKNAKVWDICNYFLNLRGFSPEKSKQLVEEYLERVELINHRNKKIAQLSSGMQQKVQIGLALIHKPEILILDEPFRGLDPMNRQMFIDMFKELKSAGTTIMYSTHVIDEAQKLANRLVIIKNGKRKVYGSVSDVRREYGRDNIQIEFDGNFPDNDKMYNARVENRSAEIIPNKGISPQEILKYLIGTGINIYNFSIDYPSLNDIFIKVSQNE